MHINQPDIRPIKESGSDMYLLMDNFVYTIPEIANVTVPKGFRSDGASNAALLFERDGVHRAACLVHDWLYFNKGHIDDDVVLSRKGVDQFFFQMLLDYGVKSWHSRLAYWAVRAFGWIGWGE